MSGTIIVAGARTHNLKNIRVEIPRDRFVVITGVSGSGKSSLAFDTLYAEGQRRYLEALSADARQLLRRMDRADVDSIEGLCPAIAVQPKPALFSPRSTVGTATEIYDYLRLLYARAGIPSCFQCGRTIAARATQEIVDELLELPSETRMAILAPIAVRGKRQRREKLAELAAAGFTRLLIGGEPKSLLEEVEFPAGHGAGFDLLVDRLAVRGGVSKRLADSLETASRQGNGVIKIKLTGPGGQDTREVLFAQRLLCPTCGISLPEIEPGLFSFNSPRGACPRCGGVGRVIKPGTRGERPRQDRICEQCHGARLKPESLGVTIGGKNIAELASLAAEDALDFFLRLDISGSRAEPARTLVGELVTRLRFLAQVGLEYVSLDRPMSSLSGGEAQRARLAMQAGSGLAGVLYLFDEPSVGLHQSDNERLLQLLKNLRDRGNTVIVVEHDPETMGQADYIIDMGPGAGTLGGRVVAAGTPGKIMSDPDSLTGRYLSGGARIALPDRRRKPRGWLTISGAREHNLKNITVKFPVGLLTCVTGVSGAGKSTLVLEILYPSLAARLHRASQPAGDFDQLRGPEHFDRVVAVDQFPIGRSPRSNCATYSGIYDEVRRLFAQLPEARVRGYTAARFSFNASGGRCEVCRGDGVVRVDMVFLPDVFVTCDVCKGSRYNRETLQVKFKGLSIAEVLQLTVLEAVELFGSIPGIAEKLRTLTEVGLGYLRLGQPAPTLSGGEAQRVKLARELSRPSSGRSLYILDEPTTGLHFDDVKKLLELLDRLIERGNTAIVIEHNLDVIMAADHVIDLGPGGGSRGGAIVAQGTPEAISATDASSTGRYLRKRLAQQGRGIA